MSDTRSLIVENQVLKRRVAELELTEDLLLTAFEVLPVPLAIACLPEWRYARVNGRFCEAVGYERDEIHGKAPGELGLVVDPAQRDLLRSTLLAEGHARGVPVDIRRRDGVITRYLVTAVRLQAGDRASMFGVYIDPSQFRASVG